MKKMLTRNMECDTLVGAIRGCSSWQDIQEKWRRFPSAPRHAYIESGWTGMGDWLGTGTIATFQRKYLPFQQARDFIRKLKLKSSAEWVAYRKGDLPHLPQLPKNIPSAPFRVYKDHGWAGMGDWLGTGNVAYFQRHYRVFYQARRFARSLGLKNGAEWLDLCKGNIPEKGKLPADIPANPNQTYRDNGWKSMGDWLGTGTIAPRLRKFLTFRSARKIVHQLKLKSASEWKAYCKGEMPLLGNRPRDIPSNPNTTYAKKGWISWGDWLGTGRIADQLKQYRSFSKARAFARNLRLKSRAEWHAFCKGEMLRLGYLPKDIPSSPNNTYANQGWLGMGDWLGTGRTRVSKSKIPR